MKTILAAFVSVVLASAFASAEEVKVPERTPAQKQDRAVNLCTANIAVAIAYAKSRGATVDDYAAFCGDQYAPEWNKEAGFAGFVGGTLGIWESYRRDDEPPIAILAQSETMIRFKANMGYKRDFKGGTLYGTSAGDFTRWIEVVYGRIAVYLGCTHTMQPGEGDFVIITITKK